MQSMVWTFLHPVQQTTMPEAENVGQFSTTPYSLSGSSNQELKEISSPMYYSTNLEREIVNA